MGIRRIIGFTVGTEDKYTKIKISTEIIHTSLIIAVATCTFIPQPALCGG